MKEKIQDIKKQVEAIGRYIGDIKAIGDYEHRGVVQINNQVVLGEITSQLEEIYKTLIQIESSIPEEKEEKE